jgi:hypothetical protein
VKYDRHTTARSSPEYRITPIFFPSRFTDDDGNGHPSKPSQPATTERPMYYDAGSFIMFILGIVLVALGMFGVVPW